MRHLKVVLVASAVLFASGWATAQDDSQLSGTAGGDAETIRTDDTPPVSARPPAPDTALRVLYKPPEIGRPERTVGGGTRGTSDRIPVVFAIAPDHSGRTTSTHPSLFWYIDRATDASVRIEFTLVDPAAAEPLVEEPLAPPTSAGLQRIRTGDYGVQLEPGKEYEWSVALIVDPTNRSRDVVARGWIGRIDDAGAAARLHDQPEDAVRLAAAYAEEGIFYDAFVALSDQIDREPTNVRLRNHRADLLRQVGLEAVASGGPR